MIAEGPPFEVIVVGSGPAGVSAAIPLVRSGVRVLMVDGGETQRIMLPDDEYLSVRVGDPNQWRWLIGTNFEALRESAAVSPKFRAPPLEYVFRGFSRENRIVSNDFLPVGSLATGGLSNAWGCGVAAFSKNDLIHFPVDETEITPSFQAVAQRIGISGRCDDDLSDFFGVDAWAQAPVPTDALHRSMLMRYAGRRASLVSSGFRLGRARLAVLSEGTPEGRGSCTGLGLCLWGCPRGALYSALHDLARLRASPHFHHQPGFVVEKVDRDRMGWQVRGYTRVDGERRCFAAPTVILAAGSLATTAIAMRSLPGFNQAILLALPMAAFALWLPRFFGEARAKAVGVAQVAFALDGLPEGGVCGFTFSTHGLPVTEFLRHATVSRRHAVMLARSLLSSTIVANCFFPSALSANRMRLRADGAVQVVGGIHDAWPAAALWVERRLRASFRRVGAVLVPGSFRAGTPGADAHYAGTMPMRIQPRLGETDRNQEVCGLPGVYVADGAALPSLPAKSHTLAIMAFADRLGRHLAHRLRTTA